VLSASADPEMVRSSLRLGASDFIHKPFNVEEFVLKVDLAIAHNRKYVEVLCKQKLLDEYKEAVDEANIVTKTNPKGIITFVNDKFCEISGYTRKELIGKPHNIVRHPDMPSSVFAEMWQTIQQKKTWQGVIKNLKKDGSSYYVQSTIKPMLDYNGEIVEYIAIRTDITELEKYKEILEADLKASNNNVNYLIQYEDAMHDYVAVLKTDTNNIITYVNDNFCQLSEYSRGELIGKNCSELRAKKHIRDGDCERIATLLKNRNRIDFLFENIDKNGNSYYVDTKIYPILNEDDEVVEFLHMMYNVTELIMLHKELEQTQREIIYKMGEIGESRSQETGNHVKRVAEYSKLLALLAGLGEKSAALLFAASPMHDIGKVAIPDAILKKPGRLTPEEFEIMKTHAEIGYNILKSSKRPILRAAAIVSYQHHEKWDGSGYPNGLAGEKIHIFGRITAIADVFDALGSDRVYKKAWELERILELFKEQRGKHFDPELIDLFLNNLDKFLKIRDKFKDV
jgi:PAS domain S-box-containing protein